MVILSIGLLVYVQYSTAQLPERFASHFGAGGTPDGWMDKDENFSVVAILGIGIPWLMAVLGLLGRFIPPRFFNVPNRDYWFSPEHKSETYLYFSRYMIWLGCLMIVLFAGLQYSTIKANQSSPAKMPNALFWSIFFGFLVALHIWAIALIQHFQKKPDL